MSLVALEPKTPEYREALRRLGGDRVFLVPLRPVAERVARDLGMDLYRIDLSAIISKYIGETEKNLDRALAAAPPGALLFFDEADALFGARKDLHKVSDRVEARWLLDCLAERDGVAVFCCQRLREVDPELKRRALGAVVSP